MEKRNIVRKKKFSFIEYLKRLNDKNKFNEIILLTTNKLVTDQYNIELYIRRGSALYNIKQYNKAIEDYNKVLSIDSEYELALYNRGITLFAKKEYDNAIKDYDKIIQMKTKYIYTYLNARGNAWQAKENYTEAINDYTKAIIINSDFENAYYNRGFAKYATYINIEEAKNDFTEYLRLTKDKNDDDNKIWSIYAKSYIEIINNEIAEPNLTNIRKLIDGIKKSLLVKKECITHYTSFTSLKKLILEESKFRLYEGNFMNDPSEGQEFFNYIFDTSTESYTQVQKEFSPKPFIGSFVSMEENDNLNMWRFYGKEEGVEAKGCAITLRTQDLIENIKNKLTKTNQEERISNESEINFYNVAYLSNKNSKDPIILLKDNNDLYEKLKELKTTILNSKIHNKKALNDRINKIAFLFKSDAFKNENEVRLVVSGIEFEKLFVKEAMPPQVYIELESIKNMVSQITLGPKVDKVTEWLSVLHYQYNENTPVIEISHLPYK